MTDWCILRTAPSSTLRLAQSLNASGFETWTPIETVERHARRSTKRVLIIAPLMPSFAFSRAARLADLIELSRSPSLTYQVWDSEQRRMVTRGHPYFSLFHSAGEIALIPDRLLNPLRLSEQRVKPKGSARTFRPGDLVRLTEGAFEGLTGTVQGIKGKNAIIGFIGWPIPVTIPQWKLIPALDDGCGVNVRTAKSEQAPSAEAA